MAVTLNRASFTLQVQAVTFDADPPVSAVAALAARPVRGTSVNEFLRAVPDVLTGRTAAWEFSHVQKQMTLVKADEKGRILIRGTRKGGQYLVTADRGGWWVMPAPRVKTPVPEMAALVADTWEKLGPAPEIDYDRI